MLSGTPRLATWSWADKVLRLFELSGGAFVQVATTALDHSSLMTDPPILHFNPKANTLLTVAKATYYAGGYSSVVRGLDLAAISTATVPLNSFANQPKIKTWPLVRANDVIYPFSMDNAGAQDPTNNTGKVTTAGVVTQLPYVSVPGSSYTGRVVYADQEPAADLRMLELTGVANTSVISRLSLIHI